MKKSHLVVLTCTVIPQLASEIKRYSPETRIRDYKISIEKWAALSDKISLDVLVVENSNSMAYLKSHISGAFRETINFQSVTPPNISNDEGISKGEFNMLKDSLIRYLDSYDFIWKCSGRNFPINCNRLLFYKSADVIVERFTKPHLSADSRFFGMTSELWRGFLSGNPSFSRSDTDPTSHEFNSMEHFLTRFATDLGFKGKVVDCFPEIPIFSEKSGSLNKQIMSPKRIITLKALNRFRKVLRRVALGYLL